MNRTGSAIWRGGLKDGAGVVSTETGVLKEQKYTFSSRFEGGGATNPEELLAAAHAACFSMALSGQLAQEGLTPEEIRTTATVTIESLTISKVHLDVAVRAAGGDEDAFRRAADNAKSGCPVSKLFNAEITMDARLES